ncbi:MAG TPA: RNA polymerase sigma factor [Caulifigura sp.]|jgi:RNA polymerase sigma-70 factor (ECF subfamily)|nr:RNA polymerase sigma factor [Caulifigura sp.]
MFTAVPSNDIPQAGEDGWVRRLASDSPEREQALEQLRTHLVRGLAKSLSHRYGGAVDVEDVAQLSLLKILDSLASFRSESRFTTWAMSIAVRIGISQLRRKYYRDISLDASQEGERLTIDPALLSTGPADVEPSRNSLLALLQKLIDERLSDKQRLAIRGTLEGLPIEEIASRLGSNRNAVYKLVHDARVRLREGFESCGVSADEIASTLV